MIRVYVAMLMTLLLVGCGSGENAEAEGQKEDLANLEFTYEELTDRIIMLDEKLQNTTDLEEMLRLAGEQSRMCEAFYLKYPKDAKAPDMLLQAGHAARTAKKYMKAVDFYGMVGRKYLDYKKRPEALFLKAFVLDEDLDRKEQAKKAYEKVINEYPDHRYARDAQQLLTQLYMSDEDILKMLKEKNNQQADSAV